MYLLCLLMEGNKNKEEINAICLYNCKAGSRSRSRGQLASGFFIGAGARKSVRSEPGTEKA